MPLTLTVLSAWTGAAASGSVTSGSYTAAAGSLVVAVAACGNGFGQTLTGVTITDSNSGTWTVLGDVFNVAPGAIVAVKDAGGAPSAETVTAAFAGAIECTGIVVLQGAGAKPAAAQNGVVVTQNLGTGGGFYVQAITPGTTGSRVVAAFADASSAGPLTPNAATLIYGTPTTFSGDICCAVEAAANSTGGTPVTIGFSSPTGQATTGWVLAEILPAAAPSAPGGGAAERHHRKGRGR